ncbi:MAG: hypothetical protein KatS3mg108_3264 [Isosphaeraceae bacterium]|jgi:hypothetical protein|nr:MAG: hypothetical protein KatS3mg108_3264 [Isosphaeraceae bacterium]
MDGWHPAARLILLASAFALAAASLSWGMSQALVDSADLLRRVEEVRLFLERVNPYQDPDLTYPPSALPIFALLLGPIPSPLEPVVWLLVNLAALLALGFVLRTVWPDRLGLMASMLVVCWVAAARPTRAGLALGQFHLIPTALAVATIPLLASGRDRLAGVLLGLSLVKPTMTAPLWLVWIVRGQRTPALAALIVQAGLFLLAAVWLSQTPWHLTADFFANARSQSTAGSLDLPSLQARVGVPQNATLAASFALLVLSLTVVRRCNHARSATTTALALACAAVVTYHRHYDLVLLMPAVVVLLSAGGSRSTLAMAAGSLQVVPTHPAWIRPLAPLLDAAVAISAYLLWAALLFQTAEEHSRAAHCPAPASRNKAQPSHAQQDDQALVLEC